MQLSSGALAARVVEGVVFAAFTLFLFYYLPQNLATILPGVSGGASTAAVHNIQAVLSSLLSPSLPLIGLALTLLVFLGALLRGSRVYGPVLILNGLLFAAYVYLLFHGGTISISIAGGLLSSGSIVVTVQASIIMYIFLVGPLLTMVKGIVVTLKPASPLPEAAAQPH